jgi:hypothetical protein
VPHLPLVHLPVEQFAPQIYSGARGPAGVDRSGWAFLP